MILFPLDIKIPSEQIDKNPITHPKFKIKKTDSHACPIFKVDSLLIMNLLVG